MAFLHLVYVLKQEYILDNFSLGKQMGFSLAVDAEFCLKAHPTPSKGEHPKPSVPALSSKANCY